MVLTVEHKEAPINIISIDPSLRSTGIFMIRDDDFTFRSIQLKDNRPEILGRFLKIFLGIAKQGWDLCIVEQYSFSAKGQQGSLQGEIGGIIRGCFAAYNIPVCEMPIQTWKAFSGFRLSKTTANEKNEYLKKFRESFDTGINKPSNPDEVDAALFYFTAQECSLGHYTKGAGDKIRWFLDRKGIYL